MPNRQSSRSPTSALSETSSTSCPRPRKKSRSEKADSLTDPAVSAQSPFNPATHRVGRVLCFAAHPDDIDFGAAGTIAAWTAAGVQVSYCIMTDGDAGGFDPVHRADIIALRAAEQLRAAELVGVSDI